MSKTIASYFIYMLTKSCTPGQCREPSARILLWDSNSKVWGEFESRNFVYLPYYNNIEYYQLELTLLLDQIQLQLNKIFLYYVCHSLNKV